VDHRLLCPDPEFLSQKILGSSRIHSSKKFPSAAAAIACIFTILRPVVFVPTDCFKFRFTSCTLQISFLTSPSFSSHVQKGKNEMRQCEETH
jgi:hypothetical protein